MVVACIALIVALGGTGYAAIKLPRNSVGSAQLRANAVTSGKVRNGSLRAGDFQTASLPRGPRGPQGPQGDAAGGGAATVLGYASRDVFLGEAPGQINVGAAPADVLGLGVPVGIGGYTATSGTLTVSAPSRLIANAQATMYNGSGGIGDINCRIAIFGAEARPIGSYVNGQLPVAGYIPIAVSAGPTLPRAATTYACSASPTRRRRASTAATSPS